MYTGRKFEGGGAGAPPPPHDHGLRGGGYYVRACVPCPGLCVPRVLRHETALEVISRAYRRTQPPTRGRAPKPPVLFPKNDVKMRGDLIR
jgi:hypothetical protein